MEFVSHGQWRERRPRLFDTEVDGGGYWLTRLKRRRMSGAMRAFSEWLVRQSLVA